MLARWQLAARLTRLYPLVRSLTTRDDRRAAADIMLQTRQHFAAWPFLSCIQVLWRCSRHMVVTPHISPLFALSAWSPRAPGVEALQCICARCIFGFGVAQLRVCHPTCALRGLYAGGVEALLEAYDRDRRVLPAPAMLWEWGWTKSAETCAFALHGTCAQYGCCVADSGREWVVEVLMRSSAVSVN